MLESTPRPAVMDFPGHFQHIFKQLNQQRLHAQLCDCVVVVGAQTFQAHRSILAACSSHFRALLSSSDEVQGGGGGQGGDGGPAVMTLDPEVVTPEAFSTLLDMIYTSTLSLGVSNVMDVLLAASHLHLNTVVKACKLHLCRKNFPASAPKGWRSMHQQKNVFSLMGQHQVTSVVVEDLDSDEEDIVVEVSQSSKEGGRESGSQSGPLRHKRKCQEDTPSDRKRTCRHPGEVYKECSPTVTRSSTSVGDGDLLSPDSQETARGLWENHNNENVERKFKSAKAELEEIQLPSQSDSSPVNGGMCGKTEGGDAEAVVKVKVGEDEEPQTALIEVKKENHNIVIPDFHVPRPSTSPLQHCTAALNEELTDEKTTTAAAADDAVGSLPSELCTHPDSGAQRRAEDLGEESVDGEGLDSLSELTFSCFLNPSIDGVMGTLEEEEEDSLASLTAAATAAAAAAAGDGPIAPTVTGESSPTSADMNTSSVSVNDSSASLVFPMASVPLQQLVPTPSFNDTIFLQPTHNSLTGFLSGISPCLSLETPSKTGKSSGATTFRRIAPKVPPGAEPSSEASSGSTGEGVDRPPLTRASEDVLSKCKKAAAEDLVLLVEGEKKYACKICSKTFMNLTDCKKHIRVHTGEKPYPCPKCGKRFSQSSHLYKHSKNTCLNWKDAVSETLA